MLKRTLLVVCVHLVADFASTLLQIPHNMQPG